MQEAVCAAVGGMPHLHPRAEGLDCRVNASIFTKQGSCCLDPVKGAQMLGRLNGLMKRAWHALSWLVSFFLSPIQLL